MATSDHPISPAGDAPRPSIPGGDASVEGTKAQVTEDAEDILLEGLGYKPVLHRTYGLIENFSTTFGNFSSFRCHGVGTNISSCAVFRWRSTSHF